MTDSIGISDDLKLPSGNTKELNTQVNTISRNSSVLLGNKPLPYIDELVQERRNSIANALELRLSCTNPSI